MYRLSHHTDSGLCAAIIAAGSVGKLAELIGTTSQNISQWQRVPPRRVRQIAARTGVPDFVLRPDLYLSPLSREKESA